MRNTIILALLTWWLISPIGAVEFPTQSLCWKEMFALASRGINATCEEN